MSKRMRIPIEIDQEVSDEIDQIRRDYGYRFSEMISDGLRILHWYLRAKRDGCDVAIIDPKRDDYQCLELPPRRTLSPKRNGEVTK